MKLFLPLLLLLMCVCPRAVAAEPVGAEIARLVGYRAVITIFETDGKVTILIAK